MSSPLGALALIIVSCKDQSSLCIAVGCVKRVVNVVGRGTAGHDRGRYVNDVLTVLQIHGILKSVNLYSDTAEVLDPEMEITHVLASPKRLIFRLDTVAETE